MQETGSSLMTDREDNKRIISIQSKLGGYYFTPKVTLVPGQFYCSDTAFEQLAGVVHLEKGEPVRVMGVPEFAAVLIYSPENVASDDIPITAFMLKHILKLQEYNKILAAYQDGVLYLCIAQGKSLLLCNTFEAVDFTTAEYFIFLALKKLQLNPEMSSITFVTPLSEQEKMSLYHYFNNVDILCGS